MTELLSSLSDLLVSGGDERLDLDAAGVNRYGHRPTPSPDDIAFGSSTASTISVEAFASLARHRGCLAERIARHGAARVHEEESDAIRAGIVGCLSAEGDPPAIILAASGTDVHLAAAALLAPPGRTTLAITLSEHETGSGIAAAIAGTHFAARTPLGHRVLTGSRALDRRIEQLVLPSRTPDGEERHRDVVAAELDRHLEQAVRAGWHCLLVVTDVSKTGLLWPSIDTVLALKARFGSRLDILVDACQLRVSSATLKAYLQQGFFVAITGSKFLGGPTFSGALLCPSNAVGNPRRSSAVTALADYCVRAHWPVDWPNRDVLPATENFGLLMRWHAALLEWKRLEEISVERREAVARVFATAVTRHLTKLTSLEAVRSAEIDRGVLMPGRAKRWHHAAPTIFPFRLRAVDERRGRALTVSECRHVYDLLSEPSLHRPAIRLGQPVAIGTPGQAPAGALRLCLSAAQLIRACDSDHALTQLIDRARFALDQVESSVADRQAFLGQVAA